MNGIDINIGIGKMPPQAIELEEAVLGSIMLEKDSIFIVIQYLKPESFYKDSHQKIFRAMLKLFESKKQIDILTVTEQLRKEKNIDEVGGPHYISKLTQRIAGSAHIENHSMIVAEKYMKREMIRISSELQTMAFDDSNDISDVIDYNSSELMKLNQTGEHGNIIHIKDAINNSLKIIEEISKGKIKFNGIPSGHTQLDRFTCGWQKSDLIILAGRPSMGKTALSLDLSKGASVFKKSILIFSLEMNITQLANRFISSETNYTNMELKTGRINNWGSVEKCVNFFEDKNIYIDDSSQLSINKFRSKSYLFKNKYNIDMIIVDYLQLMKGFGNNKTIREQEISDISRNLKSVAKELDIPVISLSQLNRAVESRSGSKRPQLSDLRESGAIEQDADIVIFINKPEKYGILEDENGNSTKNMTELIIAKHRNGSIGEIIMHHNDGMTKFWDKCDENISISNEFIHPDNNFESNRDIF